MTEQLAFNFVSVPYYPYNPTETNIGSITTYNTYYDYEKDLLKIELNTANKRIDSLLEIVKYLLEKK